jgi:hypothetical protein
MGETGGRRRKWQWGSVQIKLAPPPPSGGPWTESVLHSFNGGNEGSNLGGLSANGSGALYGVNTTGASCPFCGTVFKLTPPTTSGGSWSDDVLYSFSGGSDGAYPIAAPIVGSSVLLALSLGQPIARRATVESGTCTRKRRPPHAAARGALVCYTPSAAEARARRSMRRAPNGL